MDDAQLVAAALAGDRNAYAAIYDRYADRVHDFCASILRNRADASGALQETFLVAFASLDQLAEPARLRSWLFAIAHRAMLDRIPPASELLGGDDAGDLVWGSGSSDERLSRAELAEFVGQVSAGLDTRDRVLLDLHVRQGLEGRDLASAAGVAGSQLNERLQRLEGQAERSLGALVVARTGRRSCADLYAILNEWDGRLTADFRSDVTDHVDDCEVCNSRRRIAPSPLSLMASAPLTPAPAYLRGVVLGKAELEAFERDGTGAPAPASVNWVFQRDGFPDMRGGGQSKRPDSRTGTIFPSTRPTTLLPGPGTGSSVGAGSWAGAGVGAASATAPTSYLPPIDPPASSGAEHDRRGMLIGGLAGVIVLIAGVVILLSSRSHPGTIGVGATTSTVAATTQTSDTTPSTTAVAAVTITTVGTPSTTVASVGHLIVGGPATVDLGATASNASLMVGNDGPAQLDFTAVASGAGLTINPVAGTLASGASEALTVALDRTASAPGPFTGSVQITSQGGDKTITFNAIIDPGPTISGESATPTMVSAIMGCLFHPTTTGQATTSMVTAAVMGTEPVQEVVLHWQNTGGGSGGTGTRTMTASGFGYQAALGPFGLPGTVDWWVTAIDSVNATAMSAHHNVTVVHC